MSVLGEVADSRGAALHVVKLGSATLRHDRVFDEVRALHQRGVRLLLVAGGSVAIAEYYRRIGRPARTLRLRGGEVRYCPAEEVPHIVTAYRQITLPLVEERLARRGMSVLAATGHTGSLVSAEPVGPLRAVLDGRGCVVRDQRAGTAIRVDTSRLSGLLDVFDVVCLSPPVADVDGGTPLNVDADVLAAEVARALDADHLRLVTGTAGLLADPDAHAASGTLRHLTAGEGQRYARGGMRQKVRAAEIALGGTCDVAVTGPHTLSARDGTWFWRAPARSPDLTLLARAVELSSVSGDERELAEFLAQWCADHGITAEIDAAGNLVATRGSGPRRLLMLGHLDTVPYRWPTRWEGDALTGRGCVDAKGSLVTYLQTLARPDLPDGVQLRVVGAVQEEVTGAGAFHVRDHYPADAVVVGEPSGAAALTIGYYGLVKLRLGVRQPTRHTAGEGARTAADHLLDSLRAIRAAVHGLDRHALTAVLGMRAVNEGDAQNGEAVVDVRVPPSLGLDRLLASLPAVDTGPVRLDVLRATPGAVTSRSSALVRAFQRAFHSVGISPRHLLKKGSSDMNTLATTWHGVPMVAYGPGDSALDHTPHERVHADEFRQALAVLAAAIGEWSTL
ncbi:M20/M25/M40 family metallo-hydrolase [Streptomyces poonensis]|uniref:Bifunctional protein: acetyl-glutamate kinase acetyl-ornithine deacetylase n=1 Tax=Streptomyces poonensis TaxID=68255 RepID=A0A918PE69_9ACTN|nr:M20/M25/M40 family metallo-hydrolase [Streptomyces poonensis]GGZ01557.1 bifunctional protein: acetyl-glutamate kinase; acetyl-ornithine deacetylase [Streptomyces poonensis]GLJ90314.1 bifunctional protein: acetyl-glutamate kinase; acetyl-ornithine deacetylase [Streptomyces poonensis]